MTFDEALAAPLDDLRAEAARLCRLRHRGVVTYVVNRNANFTNICTVGCAFCGFQRRATDPDAYRHSPQAITRRLLETPGITEVCIQGGIDPSWTLEHALELLRTIKQALPQIHIHAFSPMELAHLRRQSGLPLKELLLRLRGEGLGSIPGTAAEILVDRVRRQISGNKLNTAEWVEIIRTAHRLGLRSTATIMVGHVESWDDIRTHFGILSEIQRDTGGFTEFVPLAFIPYQNRLGRRLAPDGDFRVFETALRARLERLYPLARVVLDDLIPNLQTSWVKLGPELAAQSLHWGCNDFGGTLYEESITRASGGPHGECLQPEQIEALIRRAGFIPRQRTTLYGQPPARSESKNSALPSPYLC
jgi:FO synthase